MIMRAFSMAGMLAAWEDGATKTPSQRALGLLAVVFPETSREQLAELSIGQRDAMLLTLREQLFGQQVTAVVACPGCGERLDLTVDIRELRASPREAEAEVVVNVDGYDLRFRTVNAGDAMALADRPGDIQERLDFARELLLQRCLLSASHDGISIGADQIPHDVGDLLIERMAEADPMADIQLAMACPSCERRWSAALDIVSFLWTEIEVWAWRILNDVHTLASAYGWSERDILNMSANRRQCYLQMVGA
jgi:hypothetical protein